MNLPELAQQEALLKALAKTVGDRLKEAKDAYQLALEEAQKTTGAAVGNVVPTLPDGTKIATIYTNGSGDPEARVDDMPALVQWAIVNAPTEIHREFVTTVREAFLKKILDQMTDAGTNQIADPDGVVQTVPGVSVRPRRAKTHSIRFKPGGEAAIIAEWRKGNIAIPGIERPELTT